MDDPGLFAPMFKNRESWAAWRVVLKALFALPMDDTELGTYRSLTGRTEVPTAPTREAWFVAGRRSGKSYIAAYIATYLATFRDWRPYLAPGEKAVIMLLAADRRQAKQLLRYIAGMLASVPMLAAMVTSQQAEAIELNNNVILEVHTASLRTVRGYTAAAIIADETAWWRTEDASANPDREILGAIRPTQATLPDALLLGLSSPYRRVGVLWEAYRDHYGRDAAPVLVVHGPSLALNPSLSQKVVDDASADDPAAADSEYGANFRTDVAGLLDHAWIERAARFEGDLPPVRGRSYKAFTDPSGGGRDAFTFALAHLEDGTAVVDVLRARRPPFDPVAVTNEYAELSKQYGVRSVTGDRYSGAWVQTAFADAGILYKPSELTKSEIYLEAEPLFARGAIAIPAHRPLLTELRALERRTNRSGKDQVDHPIRGSDDLANSACGAAVAVTGRKQQLPHAQWGFFQVQR
jgi:hypothetical protein